MSFDGSIKIEEHPYLRPGEAWLIGGTLHHSPQDRDKIGQTKRMRVGSSDLTFNPPKIEDLRGQKAATYYRDEVRLKERTESKFTDFDAQLQAYTLNALHALGCNVLITNISATNEKVQDMNNSSCESYAREVPTKPLTPAGVRRVTAALNALEALTIEDTFPVHASENCRSAVRSLRMVLDDDERRAAHAKAASQAAKEKAKYQARVECEMTLRQKHEKQRQALLQKQQEESAAVLKNLG